MFKKSAVKENKTGKDLQKKVYELEENWKRALADYHNLEKRIKEEQQNFLRFANAGIIDKLLKIADDLEKASEHLKDEGLKIIYNQLREVLNSEGVKEVEANGKNFDPQTMECVETTSGPKNKVMKVRVKGYLLNGRILRPAKVEVGKGDKKEA